jgi:hypothetical protein
MEGGHTWGQFERLNQQMFADGLKGSMKTGEREYSTGDNKSLWKQKGKQ